MSLMIQNPTARHFSRRYYLFLITFLGLLSAFGPFVTDMYLPTLPAMADVFHTTPSMIQMGLAASMFGLAVGQIFFGPLSDKYGRRPVLISAMILFAVATVIGIYSPGITFFNVCRFFQGLGGSGGIVLSRSVATDCYSGRELAKTLAIIGAINGIAPVSSPVIGGFVSDAVGWQGIFWILFGIGVILLAMCFRFRESLPNSGSYHVNSGALVLNLLKMLKLPYFCIYVLMFAFANGVLFSYISSASFIIQNHFGFSEVMFAIIFGINALGIGLGSALSLKFKSIRKAALCGAIGMTVAGASLFTLNFFCDRFAVYEIFAFTMLTFIGFVFTAATTLAMSEGKAAVGAASAIFGAMGFLSGGIVSPLVGIGDIMRSTFLIIFLCAASTLGFAIASFRRK